MGRRRKPTALHLIDGTYRQKDHGSINEPKPKTGIGAPFAEFDRQQRVRWRSIAGACPVGLLTRADRAVFGRYVWLVDLWLAGVKDFNEAKQKRMVDVTNGSQKIENPLLKAMRRDFEAMLAIESHLGFTPAARTRIDLRMREEQAPAEGKLKKYTTS